MLMTEEEAHIGRMTKEQLIQLIDILEARAEYLRIDVDVTPRLRLTRPLTRASVA